MIAFALNYIPFIGPFIATVFPTLLAMAQFATWQAALGVFVALNVIQFVIGSYVEPRMSGNVLSISPSIVLVAVMRKQIFYRGNVSVVRRSLYYFINVELWQFHLM